MHFTLWQPIPFKGAGDAAKFSPFTYSKRVVWLNQVPAGL